jgi:hypothetical protein
MADGLQTTCKDCGRLLAKAISRASIDLRQKYPADFQRLFRKHWNRLITEELAS